MAEKYKPRYVPSPGIFRQAEELASQDICVPELIDRLTLDSQDMSQDARAIHLIALMSRSYDSAIGTSLGAAVVKLMTSSNAEKEANWVDVGCDCPACERQRALRAETHIQTGKPN